MPSIMRGTAVCVAAWASAAYAGDGFLSQRRDQVAETADAVQEDLNYAEERMFDATRRFGRDLDLESRFGGKWRHVSPLAYSARRCSSSVDFIQIVDSELNENSIQWQYSKRMAQLLVDTFTLGTDGSHMGLLNFGGETVQVLELTDPAGQENTKAKETILELKQLPGSSYLDDATAAASQLLANARDVPHVLAVISDFATPVDLYTLQVTMDALHDDPNFVSIAVVMGDAAVVNGAAGDMIKAITGCATIEEGLCANLIRADFTYPSIMLAAAEAKTFICKALDTATEIAAMV